MIYLQENEFNTIDEIDPINFSQAIFSLNSLELISAMKDELVSM